MKNIKKNLFILTVLSFATFLAGCEGTNSKFSIKLGKASIDFEEEYHYKSDTTKDKKTPDIKKSEKTTDVKKNKPTPEVQKN